MLRSLKSVIFATPAAALLADLTLFILPLPAGAETVEQRWAQRYNGPANSEDCAVATVVDSMGNVVVTGYSRNSNGNDDYYTAKYAAADGALLWEKRYNGPGNAGDVATSVAADGAGNVVVTGGSRNASGGLDCYTAKYAAVDGSLLWEQRYNGPANSNDQGRALALDSFGNVVVTGNSTGIGSSDFYTAKYDAVDGHLLWEKRHHGEISSYNDNANAIAIDASDNVIVTGISSGSLSEFDYYTAKYAALDGTLLWEVQYNGPGNYTDGASAVVIDFAGNVIVTGFSIGAEGNNDYYTAKYASANGALLWEKRYNGPINLSDEGEAVAVDASGNVVVTGLSYPVSGMPDFYTAKYASSDGALMWEKRYNGPATSGDGGHAVMIDAAGNVIVAGYTHGAINNADFYTAKYAAVDGALLWEARYNGPASSQDLVEGRKQLALTPDGGVVVTGRSSNGTNNDYATVKYGPDITPPVLSLPDNLTAEAASAVGAVVSFSFSATDNTDSAPMVEASPASGSSFPIGTTTVNVSAVDAAGNTQVGSFTVTVRDTTKPVILEGPVIAEATSAAGAVVNFTAATDLVSTPVVEAAPASSSVFSLGDTTVAVMATDAAGNVAMGSFVVRVRDTTLPVLTVPGAITVEATSASGAVVTFAPTATDAVSTPGVVSSPGSGSTFALGMTTVNVTATDAAGNVANGSFSVTVQDTTAPTIGGLRDRTTSVTTLPDFTALPVTSDLVGVTSVTQEPLPGSALALGATVVTLTAHDAAGNSADTGFTLTRYPPDPAHTALYASGDAVPGVGAEATFTTFGVPAINDAGEVAFVGKWTSAIGDGVGIFAGKPAVLVVKVGDGLSGLGGLTFKTFADPVLDAAGHVAFLATVAGPGVRRGNDTVLVTNAISGTLELVAREDREVSGSGGARIKALKDVSLVGGEVLFTVKREGGGVTRLNDDAAFRVSDGSGPKLVVSEAEALGASAVKAFKLLGVVGGSPGQSRGHTTAGTATFFALLGVGTQTLADSTGGVLTERVATGDATGGTLPATFKSFGVVAAEADRSAFLATLNVGGEVTAANARGVFLGEGTVFEPVARVSDPVPDITGASFKSFLDPVLAPGAAAVAFAATMRGEGVRAGNDRAIFYQPEGGPLRAIAREGGQPPGTLAGTKWKSFTSLALPGGDIGPIFHATLARGGGVNAANDAGVWAVDSAGALRLLFREGELVGDETVKSFTVLNAVRGSAGVTRAFNNAALVAWRAEFANRSSAIVVTSVP